jgi:predicted lactoylglutathione lyase
MDNKEAALFDSLCMANIKQYLADTAAMRNETILNTRDQLFNILLNNANMKKFPQTVSDTKVSEELFCSIRQVQKHRNNEDAFKDIKPAPKSEGLKPTDFLIRHNEEAQVFHQRLCSCNYFYF